MEYLVQKWACQYCTYENWPASKFCVLCRAAKPAKLIDEAQDCRLDDLPRVHSPDGVENVLIDQDKWSCPACTFLNWPRALKCTQCLTPRRSFNSPESLKKSVGESQSYDMNNSSESDECQLYSPESEKSPAGAKNSSKINMKWSCNVCTYKNWFQSRFCVYCGFSKHKNRQISRKLRISQENEINKISSDSIAVASGGTNRIILEESFGELSLASSAKSDDMRRKRDRCLSPETGDAALMTALISSKEKSSENDWLWLEACRGVLDNDMIAVETYLASGGKPTRSLTSSEVELLGRPSAFAPGYTLVHLAIRFRRENILAVLLTSTDSKSKAKKRVPSLVSYELAVQINEELKLCLENRRGLNDNFPCHRFVEMSTFLLPAEILSLHPLARKRLFEELLDIDAQKELEDEKAINWSKELSGTLRCHLLPLWNRTAGDCLLDSILQATWGVMDTENVLRKALFDSLVDCSEVFYQRWRECELAQAYLMNYTLSENQLSQDWKTVLLQARQPGASLEQVHILVLAHILKRPIIVYGIKYVKSFQGENIGLAGFQGVYLPFFWDPSYCWCTPIVLGYTRGHFSALVFTEVDAHSDAATSSEMACDGLEQGALLPLVDAEEKLLPVHFMAENDRGLEEAFLHQWLDCFLTDGGLLVCQQKSFRSHILSRQMVNEWMDKYRNLSKMFTSRSTRITEASLVSSDEGDG